eukprot:CAMPEP_0181388404 /NCGR_PEP_ID=MMETSP1106-20121128/24291_1 /TAXON_ID=81844 /ORGANISM="Mantoniella antarctica, Strain SL-175" /LENGTH=51 /DNA_ID=CAMNT_0023508961 /DNA_START=57 /DNA_END=209 /DNA_ORIENTATION=-
MERFESGASAPPPTSSAPPAPARAPRGLPRREPRPRPLHLAAASNLRRRHH